MNLERRLSTLERTAEPSQEFCGLINFSQEDEKGNIIGWKDDEQMKAEHFADYPEDRAKRLIIGHVTFIKSRRKDDVWVKTADSYPLGTSGRVYK